MNILVVSCLYPEPKSYNLRSDTQAIHYFAREWVAAGHNVLIIHPYWNAFKNIRRVFSRSNHQIKTYNVENVRVIFGESQILLPKHNTPFDFQQKKLAKKIKHYLSVNFENYIPDKVIVHFPIADHTFCSYFTKNADSVCTLHGIDIVYLEGLKLDARNQLITQLNEIYSNILFRSQKLRDIGLAMGLKSCRENIILSGVDDSLFATTEELFDKIKLFNASQYKIIYAGRIVKQKRIHTIIESIALLSTEYDIVLYIVGNGSELSSLKQKAIDLSVDTKVHFLGKLDRQSVSSLMYESDIFVMLSKNETLGLVYLEAMAQGCIAIGSIGEGIDGIIEDGVNGYLCEPENPVMLSEKLKEIFSLDYSRKMQIILNSFNTVRNMTSKHKAEQYIDIISNNSH